MNSALKIGAATAIFALAHSLLASRKTKQVAARLVGHQKYDVGYRAFYNLQSVASLAMLLGYGARLPSTTLYRITGSAAAVFRASQLLGFYFICSAVSHVGTARVSGVANLLAYSRNQSSLPPPAAQGPELGADGQLTIGGPFAWSRHPLNLFALPIIWLTPHMTDKRLAFNLVGTLYFIIGSKHEAARLRTAYGQMYRCYENSGVPFFWPTLRSLGSGPHLGELNR